LILFSFSLSRGGQHKDLIQGGASESALNEDGKLKYFVKRWGLFACAKRRLEKQKMIGTRALCKGTIEV